MDSDLLKKFNAELATLHDSRNLSKNKIQEITNAAIKAQKQYKHVVYALEKLMTKCKPEQRLHVLYVIDNVVRSSKHQLKERDTFGPRFLEQWDKFMEPLLKCSWREKLKIVRTLNLWLCNRIFTETQMRPIREQWQKAGLPIDFEKVERAVKGDKADMNIYSSSYKKKSRTSGGHHRSRTPPNPPPDDGLLGAGPSASFKSGPDIPNFVLSEELVNGTISEREMLEIIQKFDIDRAGVLTKDRTLLQKVLQTFVGSLSQKITEVQSERNKENGSSIENVLTKDFEYSDDEEEKEKYAEKEEQKNMNHDEILGLAQTMLSQPAVLSKITEVFATAVNPFGLPLVPENMIPTSSAMSLGTQQNLIALQQTLPPGFANQQLGLPNLSGLNAQLLNPQNAQAALLLQQRAAQLQALQGNAANQRMLGNFMLGNPLLNPFALQAGVNPLLSELQVAAAQQAMMNEVESSEKILAEAMNNNEIDRARKEKEKEKENKFFRRLNQEENIIHLSVGGVQIQIDENDYDDFKEALRGSGLRVVREEEFRSNVIQELQFIELLRDAEKCSERNPFDVINFSKTIWEAASICLAVYFLENFEIRVQNIRAMNYLVDIICLFFTDAEDCVDLKNLWADAKMCHKKFYHHSLMSTSKRRSLLWSMRDLPKILEKSDLAMIEKKLESHEKLKLINVERSTWELGGKQYYYYRNAY